MRVGEPVPTTFPTSQTSCPRVELANSYHLEYVELTNPYHLGYVELANSYCLEYVELVNSYNLEYVELANSGHQIISVGGFSSMIFSP